MKTEQEVFWGGEFGDEYTKRQEADFWVPTNEALFRRILASTSNISSIMELGCNSGLNLAALARIDASFELNGIEINASAANKAREITSANILTGSFLDSIGTVTTYDLVFTKGVLIHIAPEYLAQAYEMLCRLSHKYVLVAEYYSPKPIEVIYRGHEARLFKRDFAGELIDRYNLTLIDYGFVYHRDAAAPQDDLTWFLLGKKNI